MGGKEVLFPLRIRAVFNEPKGDKRLIFRIMEWEIKRLKAIIGGRSRTCSKEE